MPEMINRRRVLKQTFGFSAAVLTGSGFLRAAQACERKSEEPELFHYLMIGDWGAQGDIQGQQSVANGMMRMLKVQSLKPAALFLLGDNFYGPLRGGTQSPRWNQQFEAMYPPEFFSGPCHAVLGNHDYDDEPVTGLVAELAYAKDHPGTRWNLPAKWYRFEIGPANKPIATVLALDSNYSNEKVSLTPDERDAQMLWLEAELAKQRIAPWMVVIGHHPLYSNGMHGDDEELIAAWDGLFKRHKVHFYFCGHDHDLQHLEFEKHPTSFVVSGAGGAKIREPRQGRGPFSKGIFGFTHLEVTANRFIVSHLDANGNLLHSFAKNLDGTWSVI